MKLRKALEGGLGDCPVRDEGREEPKVDQSKPRGLLV